MAEKKNSSQKVRFLVVGATATLIDFGLLFLLQGPARLPILGANIISTTTAFLFSFTANKNYTFKAKGGSLVRQMVLFTIVTLFGLWVLQTLVISLVMPLLTSYIIQTETALFIAKLLATGVTMVWNYLLYSLLVFSPSPPPTENKV